MFKKLFSFNKSKNIENIIKDYSWASEYRKIQLSGILNLLDQIQEKEGELFMCQNLSLISDKITELINQGIKNTNKKTVELNSKKEIDLKIAGLIIEDIYQYIHNQGYIKTFLNFITMIILLDYYKMKYGDIKKEDVILIDKQKFGRNIIISIFQNTDLFYNLLVNASDEYQKAINKKITSNTTDNYDYSYKFEIFIAGLVYYIRNTLDIGDSDIKAGVIEGIDNLLKNLGVGKIQDGFEIILFNIFKGFGFKGGLDQLPSYNIIHIAQAKRDFINDDYLPTIDLILNKNEKFLCDRVASLRKLKNETQYTGMYYGLTASVKITKGLRFRMGKIIVPKERIEKLETLDYGNIYLTNQRIIFKGKKKTFTVKIGKLLSIEISEYGLLIFKDGNENPYIVGMSNDDYLVFSEIISDLLNND